jgi:ribosomal protein uS5
MAGRERGGPRGRRRQFDEGAAPVIWAPKTRLGKMVKNGEITTMSDALKSGLPMREPEIVDILLPAVEDEVIDVKMVQRMTDSGRRVKFVITVVVGNKDGFVGLGQAKGKEVGLSIKRAIENAKMNMIQIRRGCGSWECGCRTPHTIPFLVTGKSGSVEVTFKYAKGVYDALKKNAQMRITDSEMSKLGIIQGNIVIPVKEEQAAPAKTEE